MRDVEPIELSDGQALLIIFKDGRVIEYTWDMGLPHVEFVKRTTGTLPDGGWVGTISKDKQGISVITSKTFYGHQMPAPHWVLDAVLTMFE